MKYLKVKWIHKEGEENEPVWLYSEIDSEGWEKRKVDIYEDGRHDFTDENIQIGETGLGLKPISSLDEINVQDSFDGTEITKEEFEDMWELAQKYVREHESNDSEAI